MNVNECIVSLLIYYDLIDYVNTSSIGLCLLLLSRYALTDNKTTGNTPEQLNVMMRL